MKILTAPQSGSQAGTTASRNRFGQYLRSRAVPVQPRTPKQGYLRAFFTIGSSGWRLLTEPQQTAWNNYAAQVQRADSLGQNYSPTGAELYAGAVAAAQDPSLTDPPAVLPFFALSVLSVTYTDPTPGPEALEVAINTNADNSFIVETSGPVSAGIQSSSAVRRWFSLPASAANLFPILLPMATSPVDVISYYKFLFPSPAVGNVIWFRFHEVAFPGGSDAPIVNRQRQTLRIVIT